ncbi:MAG: tRNA (guanine(46)-N(7))-methyltransferase TrmB [Pseudomonadota bacterium]
MTSTSDTHSSGAPWRNFYGRIKGKTLKPAQLRDLDEVLPQVRLPGVTWEENPDRTPIDMGTVFEGREVWLEVGFGGGEHVAAQAQANPNIRFIACEPFINGVATLLGKIRRDGIGNIHVHPGDARDLFDVLPDACISRAFLLYPDPWPKARHHRRRFVTPEHLGPLARVVRPGAEFRVATDIPDYVRQTLEEVPKAGFTWTANAASDWREPWGDWHRTRYEAKAIRENRVPHYLTFLRNG